MAAEIVIIIITIITTKDIVLRVSSAATRKAILFGAAFPIETHRGLKFGEKVSVEVLNSLILEIKIIKNPHTAL